jgi:hypothetical protein
VSSKKNKSGSPVRRAPQHRMNAGRHREAPVTVTEVVSTQANAGARLAAIGVLGSTTALAAPGMAAAATVGGTGQAPPGASQAATGGNAAATVPMGMTQGAPAPAMNAFAPTIHIVVIGDSYTSGEGANSSTYSTTPTEISPTGDVMPPLIYPQHQSSTSAVNQAIAALQAANPGVNIQVTNVAVSGASRVGAASPSYPDSYFTQPAQLDAVKNADIIYNGFAGGNDSAAPMWNNFSDWGKTALVAPDSFLPTVWNSLYLPKFTSPANPEGTDLPAQTAFLNSLAQLAPGATVITPSYPMPFQGKVADSWSISSPFVSSLGPNAVNLSDQFAQWLNADAQAATGSANVANVNNGNTFLDVNMLNALSGHTLNDPEPGMNGVVPFSWGQAQMGQASFHPNPLGQSLEASAIYPVLAAAVNRIGGQQGFSVNTDPPPSIQITPAYQQNADGVQAQLSLITQFQQASSLAQLAKQAQDNQLTNPDGTPTLWGQLMMGLNGQQANAGWPAAPGSQNGQSGQDSQSGQASQGSQASEGSQSTQSGQNGQAAPSGNQQQPMPDPVGGFLPPELSGATQSPPPGAWTTAPQGGSQGGGQGGARVPLKTVRRRDTSAAEQGRAWLPLADVGDAAVGACPAVEGGLARRQHIHPPRAQRSQQGTAAPRHGSAGRCRPGRRRRRSEQQDDLAADVALGEQPVGVPHLIKREGRGDRDLQFTCRDQPGQLGEHRGARTGRVAFGFDPVLLHGVEADDRVDAGRLDAEVEGEPHVVRAERVDERVELRRGLADAVGDTVAIADRNHPMPGQPFVVGGAGQADHGSASAPGELDGDRADAARRPGDGDRVPRGQRHGPHGRVGRGPHDEQRARDLPRHAGRPGGQVAGLDQHILGLAGPVVGEPDDLVPLGEPGHARPGLRHDPGQVTALSGGECGGPPGMQQALTDLGFTRVDAGGLDTYQHLPGSRLRHGHLDHVEDLDPAVLLESHRLRHGTFRSLRLAWCRALTGRTHPAETAGQW